MRENKGRWSVTFTGATAVATLILGVAVAAVPADATTHDHQHRSGQDGQQQVLGSRAATTPTAGTRTTPRWTKSINTNDQAAVDAAYRATYAPRLTLPIDWLGGSILGCIPGLSSLATNTATLTSLNFVRSLAGLAPVSFSPALNASAQKAALIMDANNSLSHHPSSGWRCWSRSGANAASKSNLAIAYPSINAGQIIDLYMNDPGSTNTAAGHRRWLLNPFSTVMGTGSTRTANALTVIGPTNASRPNPAWVGWPSAGYFPNELEPNGRWSLSSGLKSVSFKYAKVSVWRDGVRIPVRKWAVKTGYAQPTIVWQMPTRFNRSASYVVKVTGIKKAGQKAPIGTKYTVRLFTPSR